MLINDRIKLIMKANKMNAAQFADTIGVKPANLSHILSGRNKPSMDFLEKVISTFDNVNASWLLTGEIRQEVLEDSTPIQEVETGSAAETEDKEIEKIEKIVVFYKDGTFKAYRSLLDHSAGN